MCLCDVVVADMVQRKTLVLDLDETLIHSHHDGVLRQTVKPGTPPDFVLKASQLPSDNRTFIVLTLLAWQHEGLWHVKTVVEKQVD